jgi:drug/metabolite transporter (DMT)-like permease
MRDATKAMGPIEWGLLLLLSVLWGCSFFFGKVALAELPPFTVVFGRVSLAAIALNVLVVGTGNRRPFSIRMWAAFFVMGLLNNLIPFSLIFWGQTQIDSGLAAIRYHRRAVTVSRCADTWPQKFPSPCDSTEDYQI